MIFFSFSLFSCCMHVVEFCLSLLGARLTLCAITPGFHLVRWILFYSIYFFFQHWKGTKDLPYARQMLSFENTPSSRVISSGFLILCSFDRTFFVLFYFYPQTCCQTPQVQKWWESSVSKQPTCLRQNVL